MRKAGFGIRGSVFGFATAVLILTLASCSPKTPPQAAEPFPSTGEVTDWAKASPTRIFPADNLWEYVDGDAERYVQAGVVRTLTSDYKFKGRVDAVVDIHVMKTPEGAGKLLAAESSQGSKPASVGEEARLFPASLVFRKGQYLVRVVAYEETPEIGKALLALGEAIEKRLQTQRQ
jgi:hypothetical protein